MIAQLILILYGTLSNFVIQNRNFLNPNYYYIVTEYTWSSVNHEYDCTITSSQYSWNDDGALGYLTFPNDSGLISDIIISVISDAEMIIDYINLEEKSCSRAYQVKVTSVEGCPDI